MRNSTCYARMLATVIALVCAVFIPTAVMAQILETETARPLRAGQLEAGAGYEIQHSSEGNETAVPVAFRFGVTNRAGVLLAYVSPTPHRPPGGASPNRPRQPG